MIAALVVAAVAALITRILTLVVTTLLLAGCDAIVALVAIAGVAFDRTFIILIAGRDILAVIAWCRGGRCTTMIGDLACKRIRCHENAQNTERGRYQQRELFHHFFSNVDLPATATDSSLSSQAHYDTLKHKGEILAIANFMSETLAISDVWTQPLNGSILLSGERGGGKVRRHRGADQADRWRKRAVPRLPRPLARARHRRLRYRFQPEEP